MFFGPMLIDFSFLDTAWRPALAESNKLFAWANRTRDFSNADRERGGWAKTNNSGRQVGWLTEGRASSGPFPTERITFNFALCAISHCQRRMSSGLYSLLEPCSAPESLERTLLTRTWCLSRSNKSWSKSHCWCCPRVEQSQLAKRSVT